MIQPEEIRRKAERCYPDLLRAWLDDDPTFFPLTIRANRSLDHSDPAAAIQAVRHLREGSKEYRGFGYTVEWQEQRSRRFGRNLFPRRILFETRSDLLQLIGRQREFEEFAAAVVRLRSEFPALAGWIRSHLRLLIDCAPELNGLLHVLRFFRDNPRPNCFARELPLPVDTKFIERHRRVLSDWLDLTLPPHAVRADETHFERRYGLRYPEPHLLVRLLDAQLQAELRFPCLEFSLPLSTLAELSATAVHVFIIENRVNLLTFPSITRGLALWGRGCAVTDLRHIQWLHRCPIAYWGDLDVEGFGILSSLRALFPATRSLMMGIETLRRWEHLAVPGTSNWPDVPPHLSDAEQAAFAQCREASLRIEQERLPQDYVLEVLASGS